jgi:hypothetical protein
VPARGRRVWSARMGTGGRTLPALVPCPSSAVTRPTARGSTPTRKPGTAAGGTGASRPGRAPPAPRPCRALRACSSVAARPARLSRPPRRRPQAPHCGGSRQWSATGAGAPARGSARPARAERSAGRGRRPAEKGTAGGRGRGLRGGARRVLRPPPAPPAPAGRGPRPQRSAAPAPQRERERAGSRPPPPTSPPAWRVPAPAGEADASPRARAEHAVPRRGRRPPHPHPHEPPGTLPLLCLLLLLFLRFSRSLRRPQAPPVCALRRPLEARPLEARLRGPGVRPKPAAGTPHSHGATSTPAGSRSTETRDSRRPSRMTASSRRWSAAVAQNQATRR